MAERVEYLVGEDIEEYARRRRGEFAKDRRFERRQFGFKKRVMGSGGGLSIPDPSFNVDFVDLGAGVSRITADFGGVSGTFTRATTAWTVLSDGTIEAVASGSPRSYYSPDGTYLGYLAEGARTNLCQRGEDFATVWADVGTPTLSADSTTLGVLNLSTLGDDSAAALEGKTQTITFTGDAVKAISCFVKQGTSTSSVIRVRDTSAGADRLLAAITWSGTVPVVTMTTGTDLTGTPVQYGSSGIYRLSFATTSVTAANTNSLQIYPATDAALAVTGTGTILIGGVQAEDATFPSSLIRTPASATVTRNADVLTYPTTGWFNAAAGTMFVRGTMTQIVNSAFNNFFDLSDGTNNEIYRLGVDTATLDQLDFLIQDGGVPQGQLNPTGGISVGVSFNGVAAYAANGMAACTNGGAVSTDTSVTLPTVTTAYIGNNAGAGQPFGPIRRVAYWSQRLGNAQLQSITS